MKNQCIILCALACAAALACSAETAPPPLRDDDTSSPQIDASATTADPCATPAPGCACADAGEQIDCGLVYRFSGTHVDCAPGVMTCGDDGWSACIGPTIYDGGH
ncbi:MAG TPA: hypothetical protein VGH28_15220 [Polyangiaceae bacterium]|jgi:hypothetical protein